MNTLVPDILSANILIVDDQQPNVELLEKILGDAGCGHVTSTMNPLQVCALHRQNNYDLILLDLQMPDMDGFQVMEGLKTNATDAYLSVLVITAQPGHKLRALQAGAKDFISKPFDIVEVTTRIYNLLEVRLLYKKLENYSKDLQRAVTERTAELRASDWYWEQDENGTFTKVSGPVLEMLGIQVPALAGDVGVAYSGGWNEAERDALRATIAARQPFLDFVFTRVSGEPMINSACRFIGYRGVGVELLTKR